LVGVIVQADDPEQHPDPFLAGPRLGAGDPQRTPTFSGADSVGMRPNDSKMKATVDRRISRRSPPQAAGGQPATTRPALDNNHPRRLASARRPVCLAPQAGETRQNDGRPRHLPPSSPTRGGP